MSPATASSPFRPAVSSPLSSSPIRASASSDYSPPRHHHHFRATQSSPIAPPPTTTTSASASKFKYATRNPRPNPVVKRREEAQDSRRRLFLQNVRQRADEHKWERRGGEDELLKLEWVRLNRELRQAKHSDTACMVSEGEIEDEPAQQLQPHLQNNNQNPAIDDVDALMVNAIEQQEEAELNALLSSLPDESPNRQSRPWSPHFFLDDDDYDGLFMDFLSQQSHDDAAMALSQDVEMS
ncbi:hypothetical protein B0T26DRAFT_737864 [Lasiosphaeria miniovina]|uniref:Uncharacterized protein n=1 Tax=Lasiosphaeria miniovina TaxID=1954250 RepID=A0AA40E7N6_9PEZI|nr:uncharacterized protein B0T26DRAFT_737864 [Lasiosphaeria miniovina]KAK0727041.1 hypothetical protein B0T26DRAFT_737864 [Lasiosphaeria miniovina]